MNPMKRFVCAVLAVSLVLLASLAALVVLVDPFFQFHTPGDAEVFENERYENPGMIRNLEYDTVLMGTSLVCNYRASWFDELTGGQTIKIAYRDGYLSDFDTALSLPSAPIRTSGRSISAWTPIFWSAPTRSGRWTCPAGSMTTIP